VKYEEQIVTEDNAPRIAELCVKGLRYVNPPFTRGDLLSIAWIEIHRARIGQPIGSTITFIRMYLIQCMRRSRHKLRNEVLESKLKKYNDAKDQSVFEENTIDWALLSVDIHDWVKVEVLALEGTIPDKQYIASKLFLLDGLEQKEIANKLSISMGTVQCYISRTRVTLTERWLRCRNE